MTFDKLLEKATLVDTIAFTIFFCIGQDAIGILTVLVIIPMTGLAVLAIHEGASDRYKHLKDTLKNEKVQLQKQGLYDGLVQALKQIRMNYILAVLLVFVWNILIFVVIILGVDKYYYEFI